MTSNINFLDEIIQIKKKGNELLSNGNEEKAIEVFEQGLDYIASSIYSQKDGIEKKSIVNINIVQKQMMSNLALCYYKKKDYDKCIELDKGIISIDVYFDKSYARLYNCFKLKGLPNVAIEYGNFLIREFNDTTLQKYQSIVKEINDYHKKDVPRVILWLLDEKNFSLILPILIVIFCVLYYFYKKFK